MGREADLIPIVMIVFHVEMTRKVGKVAPNLILGFKAGTQQAPVYLAHAVSLLVISIRACELVVALL